MPVWFDNHVEESFSVYEDVQYKKFCLAAKTSCLSAGNIHKTPVYALINKCLAYNMKFAVRKKHTLGPTLKFGPKLIHSVMSRIALECFHVTWFQENS